MSQLLCPSLIELACSPKTLTVFVLNAGKDVQSFWLDQASSPANTFFATIEKKSWGKKASYTNTPPEDIGQILIVDDVVASGETASAVLSLVDRTYPEKPCYFATWIYLDTGQANLKENDTGLSGFDGGWCGLAVRPSYGFSRPPINSLSTLLAKPMIRQDYVGKYAKNARGFNQILNSLERKE